MVNWESELQNPLEGEEWSKLDYLVEVARFAAIEFERYYTSADGPQSESANAHKKSVPGETKNKKRNLGFDSFNGDVVPKRPLKIQEPFQESSSSSSFGPICDDCLTRLLESGNDYEEDKLQFKKQKKIHNDNRFGCSYSSFPRELPAELVNLMRQTNGFGPKLIIKKRLFMTDVNKKHGRLSIPFSLIEVKDFLTLEEERIIDLRCRGVSKVDVGVILIDPSSRKWNLNMRRWDMAKKRGKASSMFVLVSGWNQVFEANGLKEGDEINLWTFRSQQRLHCYLDLPERGR